MINKKVNNVQEALEGVKNGMTFMLGGFGLCGIPENAISELVKLPSRINAPAKATAITTLSMSQRNPCLISFKFFLEK